MQGVEMWAAAVCLTVLAAALLRMVCPEGSFSRLLRIILGAFVLCALLQPLGELVQNLSRPEQSYDDAMEQAEDFTSQAEGRSGELMESSLESLIRTELVQEGIPFEKIAVSMDTGEEDRIVIRRIQVTVSQSQDVERAEALLRESLGLETEVTANET